MSNGCTELPNTADPDDRPFWNCYFEAGYVSPAGESAPELEPGS